MIIVNKGFKIFILFCLLIIILLSCKKNKKLLPIEQKIEQKIDLIIKNRQIYLASIVYKNEKETMRQKYQKERCDVQSDISAIGIENQYGMFELFGDPEKRQIFDPFGDMIVEKWSRLNYDPNYYNYYDKVATDVHFSFLKMMDFYNSDDMKKYHDSLRTTLVKRFHLKDDRLMNYLENEYNFKNRMIWDYQRDTILTLNPLENPVFLDAPPQPPNKNKTH